VIKEIEKIKEVIKEVPVEVIKEIEIVKEIPIEVIKEVEKIVEVIKEVEIIKEIEVIKEVEVEVVKEFDFDALAGMMESMEQVEVSRTEVQSGSKPKKVKAATKKKATKKKAKKDDLTKIEGIGPKIAGLLNADGIHTFKELAATKVKRLEGILDAAGPRYRMHIPKSWPSQSKLAASGQWKELEQLQDKLSGGK